MSEDPKAENVPENMTFGKFVFWYVFSFVLTMVAVFGLAYFASWKTGHVGSRFATPQVTESYVVAAKHKPNKPVRTQRRPKKTRFHKPATVAQVEQWSRCSGAACYYDVLPGYHNKGKLGQ